MKKKIALITTCLFLSSSAAMAAPLTDYSLGKISIDLNYRDTKNTANSIDYPSKYHFEPSITIGLGNKFAFQYRNVNSKSGDGEFASPPMFFPDTYKETNKLAVDEFNLLYRLNSNVSVFGGYVSAKMTSHTWIPDNSISDSYSIKKDTWQLGLVGSVPLGDKFTAYGVLGAGDKYTNYEIGLSYAFTKNVEFNVDYRGLKLKGFDGDFEKIDVKANGLGFGVTCKF